MDRYNDPHDRFFKAIFSRVDATRDFVENYLPGHLVSLMDTQLLHLCKGTFVDTKLKAHFSDLLYRVALRQSGLVYIYILLEHKSAPDPFTPLHLLRYMVRGWEMELTERSREDLPMILPVVIYHGRSRWPLPGDLGELIEGGELWKPYVPRIPYLLVDLHEMEDGEIGRRGEATLKVSLLLMKHIFHRRLGTILPGILALARRLGRDVLEAMLEYLYHGASGIGEEELVHVVEESLHEAGVEIMPTIAETISERSYKRGIQEGIQEAREMVMELMEDRLGERSPVLEKSLEGVEEIAVLRRLFRRALRAGSVEELLGALDGE